MSIIHLSFLNSGILSFESENDLFILLAQLVWADTTNWCNIISFHPTIHLESNCSLEAEAARLVTPF